ncbi:MAG: hypothetical protein OEN02_09395 [Gammaproteobacteria bacterium]|nr:hypothetical protein [Gammaproteobacteria bacterium]
MNAGDRVYYLYTDKNGTEIKYAAIILAQQDEGYLIRIGSYDVHTREIKTLESIAPAASLEPRSIPCSYENELNGRA